MWWETKGWTGLLNTYRGDKGICGMATEGQLHLLFVTPFIVNVQPGASFAQHKHLQQKKDRHI